MPTLLRRGLFQASVVVLLLALAANGPAGVDARRRRSKAAATNDDKAATEQYDQLPPPSPPQWKGKIGTCELAGIRGARGLSGSLASHLVIRIRGPWELPLPPAIHVT